MNARARLRATTMRLLVFFLLITCAVARSQSAWKTYSYSADGFSISSPAEPVFSQQDVPTAAGTFTVHMYFASMDNLDLGVAMNDYGNAVNGRDPQTVLDGAMNGVANNMKAHIVQSGKTTIGDHPGNSFEAESDQVHVSGRIYLVGSVLYQVLVITPIKQGYADTERFFASFQLIQRSQR